MPHTRADLELAQRQVEDAEQRVLAQKHLVNLMIAQDRDTKDAKELLRQMLTDLDDMRERRDKIAKDFKRY
jgi:hypothetical protein